MPTLVKAAFVPFRRTLLTALPLLGVLALASSAEAQQPQPPFGPQPPPGAGPGAGPGAAPGAGPGAAPNPFGPPPGQPGQFQPPAPVQPMQPGFGGPQIAQGRVVGRLGRKAVLQELRLARLVALCFDHFGLSRGDVGFSRTQAVLKVLRVERRQRVTLSDACPDINTANEHLPSDSE